MHPDSNSKGHVGWFYFTVKNLKAGEEVKFRIVNLRERSTQAFKQGAKIWVFSKKMHRKENLGWVRGGYDINAHLNEDINSPLSKNSLEKNNAHRKFKIRHIGKHTLEFSYKAKYDRDDVYFASGIPYTYENLLQDLHLWSLNFKKAKN